MPWQITLVRLLTRMLMGGGRVYEEGTSDKGHGTRKNSDLRLRAGIEIIDGIATAQDHYFHDCATPRVDKTFELGDGLIEPVGMPFQCVGADHDPARPLGRIMSHEE